MNLTLKLIDPKTLNPRQRENYNFQKVSALLADFGFSTIRLSDDWDGADFIAQHVDGEHILKVQLKGRVYVSKRYEKKNLWICFPDKCDWYLFPHDVLLEKILKNKNVGNTKAWAEGGAYSFPYLSAEMTTWLAPYKIEASAP